MTQQEKTSLQQLRQALDDLRHALEAVESTLTNRVRRRSFRGRRRGRGTAPPERRNSFSAALNTRGLPRASDGQELGLTQTEERRDT